MCRASFHKVIGLGGVLTCARKSSSPEKLRFICNNVLGTKCLAEIVSEHEQIAQ